MPFRLEPTTAIDVEVRRVGAERLDDALARLEGLEGADPEEIERAVHGVRKRCKEVRALARLVRPALGDEFGRSNGLIRDAASELASIRDAHALLGTLDKLRASAWLAESSELEAVRARQAELAATASASLAAGDPRIDRAHALLGKARRRVDKWDVPSDFEALAQGLSATYARGARDLRRAERRPTDERLHEWRKVVKRLWYQVRLVQLAAPSVLGPMVANLDTLSELLGEDHDLAVLAGTIEARPKTFGGKKSAKHALQLCRDRQAELRADAFRLGDTMYAVPAEAFVARVTAYWAAAVELGPEPRGEHVTGMDRHYSSAVLVAGPSLLERERRFLLSEPPRLLGEGTPLRQGYLALDGNVAVRVRDADAHGRTLTVKAGAGPVRTELEWGMSRREFEAAWELTEGRRVQKVRYRIPHGDHVIEVDVFGEALDGLIVAEVEFDSDETMAAFEPPPWFGREVSNDLRYSNAALAVDGLDTEDYV